MKLCLVFCFDAFQLAWPTVAPFVSVYLNQDCCLSCCHERLRGIEDWRRLEYAYAGLPATLDRGDTYYLQMQLRKL